MMLNFHNMTAKWFIEPNTDAVSQRIGINRKIYDKDLTHNSDLLNN